MAGTSAGAPEAGDRHLGMYFVFIFYNTYIMYVYSWYYDNMLPSVSTTDDDDDDDAARCM